MTSRTKKTPENPTFESTLETLAGLVEKLEAQELSLDDSLAAFETGIALSRKAQHSLAAAEQKVRLLTEKNGDLVDEACKPDEGRG